MADGTVVVAYLDTTLDGVQEGLATVMVTTSDDGGRTFGEPVQAGVFREIHFRPRNSFFRWWGAAFPQVTVGPGDEIYVAITAKPGDRPTDDGDIILLRSLDKGQNLGSAGAHQRRRHRPHPVLPRHRRLPGWHPPCHVG